MKKEQKIMEVVFSSIRASHYFYARMIALLLVILTHIGIYVIGGFGALLFFKDMPLLANSGVLNHFGRSLFGQYLVICLGQSLYVCGLGSLLRFYGFSP